MQEFIQNGPELRKNQFLHDQALQTALVSLSPDEIKNSIEQDLTQLGQRVSSEGDIFALAQDALRNEPELQQYDAWGKRLDAIHVSEAWKHLQKIAAETGIVATAYEKKEGEYSRLHQAIRLYLFHASSSFFSCPLAMTDGAARVLELMGSDAQKKIGKKHLQSRLPEDFWTSGQWMTERSGGSDVSRTETIAHKESDGYRLHGTKWFTSATTSEMTMALARTDQAPAGSRGLSLFLVRLDDKKTLPQYAEALRLKDKLGTRALPTAELKLNGIPAEMVGELHKGVKNITPLLTISRFYNTICSLSGIRRILALAIDYSGKREAFGRKLSEHPLHIEYLARQQIELAASLHTALHTAHLLGREETGIASSDELGELRLLVPLLKLYTGKQATACTSELLETFGGAGYIEDTGLPLLLRDAQVFSLWEGTTNILSLDSLRAIEKENALEPFLAACARRISEAKKFTAEGASKKASEKIEAALESASRFLMQEKDPVAIQANARDFAFTLYRVYTACLLLQRATRPKAGSSDKTLFLRWCEQDFDLISEKNLSRHKESQNILGF